MIRDPAIAEALAAIAATHRRMASRLRRAEFLSRQLRVTAPPSDPPAAPDAISQSRCVSVSPLLKA